jgi:hypothetical protein
MRKVRDAGRTHGVAAVLPEEAGSVALLGDDFIAPSKCTGVPGPNPGTGNRSSRAAVPGARVVLPNIKTEAHNEHFCPSTARVFAGQGEFAMWLTLPRGGSDEPLEKSIRAKPFRFLCLQEGKSPIAACGLSGSFSRRRARQQDESQACPGEHPISTIPE